MEKKDILSSCSESEEQQMQLIQDKSKESCMTTEEKVDSSKALDASLVIIESNGTESQEQDTSSRSGNDAHVDDADIRPIYNEEPMAEVQTTAEINIFATGQQHTEQPEFNNEGEVDQNAEQCHDIRPLPAKLTDNMTTELSDQSLESENVCLKKTVAQFQKDFSRMEAHCVNLELKYQNQVLKEGQQGQFLNVKSNEAKEKGFAVAALKNELRKLTGNSVNTKFAKPSILGKPVLQPHRNQRGRTQSLVAKKKDISENRASRNFDLMITKTSVHISSGLILHQWCLLKITLQAPFLNVQRCLIAADQASVFMAMTSFHINSGLVLHQMTSDHKRSKLGIQDHRNEQSSSKLVPKVVPLAVKTTTSRQELELLIHHHIAMLRTTEHPSDTNVFTMKMEILLEPASNKLLVGDLRDSI
ncbi:hypothetical protein Tco_1540905 [Tanacetum coccineum]